MGTQVVLGTSCPTPEIFLGLHLLGLVARDCGGDKKTKKHKAAQDGNVPLPSLLTMSRLDVFYLNQHFGGTVGCLKVGCASGLGPCTNLPSRLKERHFIFDYALMRHALLHSHR